MACLRPYKNNGQTLSIAQSAELLDSLAVQHFGQPLVQNPAKNIAIASRVKTKSNKKGTQEPASLNE